MNVNSVISVGYQGVQKGFNGLEENAQKVASLGVNSNGEPSSVVEPVVGLIENEALVKASISVIKTADELLGSIIDINA